MKITLVWMAALALVGLVAFAAALLVPACGLRLPFTSLEIFACPVAAKPAAQPDHALRDSLRQEVAAMELRLAGLQCPAPVPPAPSPETVQDPLPPPPLDADLLERADLGELQGCWQLDSAYSAQNMVTGVVIDFPEWTMCFDSSGSGTETMRGSDGSTCEGPVKGTFLQGEALVVEEAADLPCSGDFAILRRRITCRLDADQQAACDSYQPEGGGVAEVIMRRAEETR